MGSTNELSNRINQVYGKLSKGQKRLASYITDHYDKAAFLTAARLGEAVGVSESTVVRFAVHLGYKGYPQFQKVLQEQVKEQLGAARRIETDDVQMDAQDMLSLVLSADAERIGHTLAHIDRAAFALAVDTILNADHIYILGIRSCAPLAEFLAFYFHLMFEHVHLLHTNSSSELFEQMVRISSKDVMIGISFPRYSMRTLKAMEFANHRSAKVITLTDSVHSPMNLYSSCNLIAESTMSAAMDSLVAPFSVVHALIMALCEKKQTDVARMLETLESVWEEYQVYGNDEINYIGESFQTQNVNGEKTGDL